MNFEDMTIEELREYLKSKLEHYDFPKHTLLDIDEEVYREIMLNKEDNSFAIPFDLVKKLDLSNFSFDNVNVRYLDFRGSKGVVINPEKVFNKDLSYCILEGAKIEGSFDDTAIYYTNFKGTNGIKINPQKIKGKNIAGCVLTDTTITGSFDDVFIRGTVFAGSCGAIVDLDKIYQGNIQHTDFTDSVVVNNATKNKRFKQKKYIEYETQEISNNVKIIKKQLKKF